MKWVVKNRPDRIPVFSGDSQQSAQIEQSRLETQAYPEKRA